MDPINSMLREHAFFEELDDEAVRYIASCGYERVFRAGEMVAKEGADANDFFLVIKGRLAVQLFAPHLGAVTLHTVGPNGIVGWSWLFPPYKWNFDIKAMEVTKVVALNGRCLREKCERDYELGYKLMKKFSQMVVERLHQARMQLLDMYK